MKMFSRFAVTLLAAVALTLTTVTHAQQTTLTATTLAAAQTTSTQRTVSLASATGVLAGYGLFIDGEEEVVISITGTTATVARGVDGSTPTPHLTASAVLVAAPGNFYFTDPIANSGCTRTSENALPHVNPASGSLFDCLNGVWVQFTSHGRSVAVGSQLAGGVASKTYTALGAITIAPGLSFINGTTLAMTLANPTIAQNGMVMIIMATNASAHTVTYTAGFNGGTTSRDVSTYGGAIGDNMVIIAVNGVWWVISSRNVTFG